MVGVTIPENSPDRPEYERTFHDLVMRAAEDTRLEHEELTAHGFRLIQVIGSSMFLYERGGRFYSRDYALAQTRAIKEDRRDG